MKKESTSKKKNKDGIIIEAKHIALGSKDSDLTTLSIDIQLNDLVKEFKRVQRSIIMMNHRFNEREIRSICYMLKKTRPDPIRQSQILEESIEGFKNSRYFKKWNRTMFSIYGKPKAIELGLVLKLEDFEDFE